MELKFEIDESCKMCRKTLKHWKLLHKRNRNAYGGFVINLHPKTDKELYENRVDGIILRPDYNYMGYLTHFHIVSEKEWIKKVEEVK